MKRQKLKLEELSIDSLITGNRIIGGETDSTGGSCLCTYKTFDGCTGCGAEIEENLA